MGKGGVTQKKTIGARQATSKGATMTAREHNENTLALFQLRPNSVL